MRIKFEEDSFLEISVVQKGTVGVPYDCAIEYRLVSEVSSSTSSCWIDGSDMSGFLTDLRSLDETMKGKASLCSESPGKFLLEIMPVDLSGHFVLLVEVGRKFYIESSVFEAKALNSFPLDTQSMSNLCKKMVAYFEGELNS